ncbi:MAG: 4-hydroxythreonine-4-phosphate dehydrogenase PdxA [Gemmatimonadetes bacterium]|nr:MAG: 4-hydroxythreonine-4-phosphate dehydrogenase PdxA [Gemmatimonadota bacterium]
MAPLRPLPARPRLAVVVGDARGIGPEVVRKAMRQPLNAEVQIVGGWDDDGERSELEAGRAAAQSIEAAARQALAGQVDAIVTGPVHKQALHTAGYQYPGVTEFLAHLAGDVPVAMMLATGRLRVVLVTTHLPLRDVVSTISTERIVQAGRITTDALQRWWGIAEPRLAVCALNPHAGEGGLFGDEDERVLHPAATALGAAGPLSADTVFVKALRGEFDAVLAPYHDVGMTAVKVSGFGTGVNVTLGLPFIRTAPDHGTAFDIAGKGVADAGSMRAALELAVQLAEAKRDAPASRSAPAPA